MKQGWKSVWEGGGRVAGVETPPQGLARKRYPKTVLLRRISR